MSVGADEQMYRASIGDVVVKAFACQPEGWGFISELTLIQVVGTVAGINSQTGADRNGQPGR